LTDKERSQIQNHTYFKENIFANTRKRYLEALERISLLLDDGNHKEPTTSQPVLNTTSSTQSFYPTRLPRIDLPKFNGTLSDWLSFKDLFTSLVVSNPALTSVEKLQYLKTSVVGSAAHLLKNTTLTADNFQKAWDSLIAFHENKRLLVEAALHSLFSLKRMTSEFAIELEQLYSSITQIYRSLETLQRPISSWDDILVFIAVRCLDVESVKIWNHHLGSSREPATWNQFSKFLITRLLSLQAFEKYKPGKSTILTNSNKIRVHYQGTSNPTSSSKKYSCVICMSNHYIAACPQYN